MMCALRKRLRLPIHNLLRSKRQQRRLRRSELLIWSFLSRNLLIRKKVAFYRPYRLGTASRSFSSSATFLPFLIHFLVLSLSSFPPRSLLQQTFRTLIQVTGLVFLFFSWYSFFLHRPESFSREKRKCRQGGQLSRVSTSFQCWYFNGNAG